MGSSYFYLEFLIVYLTLLRDKGFKNPAVFALEYSLVPDAIYPTQLQEAVAGYNYVLSITNDSKKICVGGDSAGGTLSLSLLLHIGSKEDWRSKRPGFATLISPWTNLISDNNRDTPSDFLSSKTLESFGRMFAGSETALDDPLVSPGTCQDKEWWARAIPSEGILIYIGSEEVLAPEALKLIQLLEQARPDGKVKAFIDEEGIHAWPVGEIFLCDSLEERTKGLTYITDTVRDCLTSGPKKSNGFVKTV